MNLYTDGTIPATLEQAQQCAAELLAAEVQAEREAAAAEVQALIDATPALAEAGLTVEADPLDPAYVIVNFPVDAGTPRFWAAAGGEIVMTFGGQYPDPENPYRVRQRKSEWADHFERILPAL